MASPMNIVEGTYAKPDGLSIQVRRIVSPASSPPTDAVEFAIDFEGVLSRLVKIDAPSPSAASSQHTTFKMDWKYGKGTLMRYEPENKCIVENDTWRFHLVEGSTSSASKQPPAAETPKKAKPAFPRIPDKPGSYRYAEGVQKPLPEGWRDIVVGPPERDARTFPEWKDDPRYMHVPFNHHNGLPFDLEHTTKEVHRLNREAANKGITNPKPLTKEECWTNVFPRPSAGQVTFLEYFQSEAEVWDAVRKFIAVAQRDVGLKESSPFPGKNIAHILEGYFASSRDEDRARPQWCGIGPCAWIFEAMALPGPRSEPASWLSHPFRKFASGGFHVYYGLPNGCVYPPVPESMVPGAIVFKQDPKHEGSSHYDVVVKPLSGGRYSHVGSNETSAVRTGALAIAPQKADKMMLGVVHWWEPAIRHLRRVGKGGESHIPKPIPCAPHDFVSPLIGNFKGALKKGSEWTKSPHIKKEKTAVYLANIGKVDDEKGKGASADPIARSVHLIFAAVEGAAHWPQQGYDWAHAIVVKGDKDFGKEIIGGLCVFHRATDNMGLKNLSDDQVQEVCAKCFEGLATFEATCRKRFSLKFSELKKKK